jgi:GNAT superfamily N-acetyltransferase
VPRFSDPEPLWAGHVIAGFRSDEASLDAWLRDRARGAAAAGSARTYVVVDGKQQRVVGYHALTVASVEHAAATPRARKGMPGHPIPVVLLARLAVDESVQGRGIGSFLLRDAMTRTAAAAGRFGIRALLVHALHDEARAFYVRHGLEPSPTDDLHLMILVKDIRAAIEAARRHPPFD